MHKSGYMAKTYNCSFQDSMHQKLKQEHFLLCLLYISALYEHGPLS